MNTANLYNKQSPPHYDRAGIAWGWDLLQAGGQFTGGRFVLSELGLHVDFLPGDVLLVRGTLLKHHTERWEGLKRLAVVHFIHREMINALGFILPDPERFM